MKGKENMKKKIIAGILVATMLFASGTIVYAEGWNEESAAQREVNYGNFTSGNYKYTVLTDGTVQITGYTGNETNVSIPEKLNGKTVSSIGSVVFDECDSIETIRIPAGVIEIEIDAINYCEALTNIYVDAENSMYTSVDGILFTRDKETLVKFPEAKNIQNYAVPDGVTEISNRAFASCNYLESVQIPASVTDIGYAFSASHLAYYERANHEECCKELKEIIVDENNANYSSQDGVLFNREKTELILFPYGRKQTSYTVPASVKVIRGSAFHNNLYLNTVRMEENVETISALAFFNCESLKSVYILNKNCEFLENETADEDIFDYGNEDNAEAHQITLYGYKGSTTEEYANCARGVVFADYETAVEKGNLNGDDKINIVDLMMCLHHVSGRTLLTGNTLLAADINGDGKVNIVDLMRMLHYVSGRNSTL